VFGGESGYLHKGEWEFRTSMLHFLSDKHYIGTERNLSLTAFDGPINNRTQLNFDFTYGLTSRTDLTLDIPFQVQSYNLHKPLNRIESGATSSLPVPVNTDADGVGDLSLSVGRWMFSTEHSKGNVHVSLGVQFPTGDSSAVSTVYNRAVPVDISVQPGTGGWGFIPTIQAFRTFNRFSVYGVGTYLINPVNTTGTPAFFSTLFNSKVVTVNSSTDAYMVEFGASVPTPLHWISPTIAYRISGVPPLDLIGASDGFRRPAQLGYIEPGVNLTLLGHTVNLTVPIATYINVKPHYVNGVNQNTDATVPGFMFTLSYSFRFGGERE
jgi:hypothetical protein